METVSELPAMATFCVIAEACMVLRVTRSCSDVGSGLVWRFAAIRDAIPARVLGHLKVLFSL